jgi:uncharacterized membrane protein
MADNPVEVFVAAFDNEQQAGAALKDFRSMDHEGSIELIDAAVVVRGADGKVSFEETADPGGKKWAKRGGIWGKIRDKGFKDDDLKAIGDSLEPGTSAIIAIAEDRVVERLQKGLEGYRNIARHAVSAEAAAQISTAGRSPCGG